MKKLKMIVIVTILLTVLVFVSEQVQTGNTNLVERNSFGQGKKQETYELTVEGEGEKSTVEIEVEERRLTQEETAQMFETLTEQLDEVVLGENESFDRVEKNLHLVTSLSGYPAQIQWELSRYDVLSPDGEIREEKVDENGTLVEISGVISYEKEQTLYIRSAMIYPLTRVGNDKLMHDIQQEIKNIQEETKEEASFKLPEEVSGRKLGWKKKTEKRWYYIPLLGISMAAVLLYREHEKVKRMNRKREEELLREYPGLVSKFTMLLGTGATVKHAMEKLTQSYEKDSILCEELKLTLREMQSGITEAEAYERFGKRCNNAVYLKFGTLLSQNLRKGNRGLSDILRMEAVQAFENRKNKAKRLGEEAGTKLLMPMFGMLAVVFVMVMVPAFLSMQ